MKTTLFLAVGLLLIGLLCGYNSDNFMIGCYTYTTPYSSWVNKNHKLMDEMKNAHYNATEWDFKVDADMVPAKEFIHSLDTHGIDSYIRDFYSLWSGNTLCAAGAHTLSTGNHYTFEAEYTSSSETVPGDLYENEFFYKFNLHDSTSANDPVIYRTGSSEIDNVYVASNTKTWKCSETNNPPDQAGIAISNLQTRWPFVARNTSDDTKYRIIGTEFQFALHDGAGINGNSGSPGDNYLSFDSLYIKIRFRLSNVVASSEQAMTFGCRVANSLAVANHNELLVSNYSKSAFQFVPLTHIRPGGESDTLLTYTFAQLTNPLYSTPINQYEPNGYRTITFRVSPKYFSDNNMLNKLRVETCSMYGIDPYVYWHGHGTVYIDNIEIYDKTYQAVSQSNIALPNCLNSAATLINNRIQQYNTGLPCVKRFYLLNEPTQPQLYTNKLVEDMVYAQNIKHTTTTVGWGNDELKKPDGTRFSMPELYLEKADPPELMINYYPLEPIDKWNVNPDIYPECYESVQWQLDQDALKFYLKLKKECSNSNPPKPFYIQTQAAGRWQIDAQQWSRYQLPTPNMQKCLQFLPLCYGVSGIFNFKLQCDPIGDVTSDYFFYAPVEMSWTGSDWTITETNQYLALMYANDKISTYGPLIKLDNLTWIDACTIRRSGLFRPAELYTEAVNSIDSLYAGISAFDPTFNYNNPQPNNPYEGYIQAGFYLDNNQHPYYMIVNRRTDFVNTSTGTLQFVTPQQMRSGNNYTSAPSQIVSFMPKSLAHSNIGTHIALYDPSDNTLYKQSGQNIDVPIGPGDGKLLQMVGTLPSIVTANEIIKSTGYLCGNINISNNSTVCLDSLSDVTLLDSTVVYVNSGSTLRICGKLTLGKHSQIIVDSCGYFICSSSSNVVMNDSTVVVITSENTLNIEGEVFIGEHALLFVSNSSTLYLNGVVTTGEYSSIQVTSGSTLNMNGVVTVGEYSLILVTSGSTLNIGREISFDRYANIAVDTNGKLNFCSGSSGFFSQHTSIASFEGNIYIDNSTLAFATNSGIDALNSTIHIYTSFLMLDSGYPPSSIFSWNGIDTRNCNIDIIGSDFINAKTAIKMQGGSLNLKGGSFTIANSDIYRQRCGIYITNTLDSVGVTCPPKVFISGRNRQSVAFIGDNSRTSKGIYIENISYPLSINQADFTNLNYGIDYSASVAKADSVTECNFYSCNNGIKISGSKGMTSIKDCNFIYQGDEPDKNMCIDLSTYQPIINNCNFAKGHIGIRLDMVSRDIRYHGSNIGDIYNCHFDSMYVAIEGRESNSRLTHNFFNHNAYGIANHDLSFLDCSYNAYNHFQNVISNFLFPDPKCMHSSIQLYNGHNDFIHQDHCVDFTFGDMYEYEDKIDANYNYWQNNAVLVTPQDKSDYIEATYKDEYANIFTIDPESRYYRALAYLDSMQYSSAREDFQNIIVERQLSEKMYWGGSVNGIFQTFLFANMELQELLDFYQSQIDETPTEQESLALLMRDYMAKVYIKLEQYQEAADLISLKLDDPESEIDSLNAVLDLEIVYLLQSLQNAKQSLVTRYSKYKYNDIATYTIKHEENWVKLRALLEKGDEDTTPIPLVATLYQNYPNPFNPSTTISFAIPKETQVKIKIYNIKGQMVKQLCNETKKRGQHKIVWDGTNNQNRLSGSGLYLVRLETKDKVVTKKAMMLK